MSALACNHYAESDQSTSGTGNGQIFIAWRAQVDSQSRSLRSAYPHHGAGLSLSKGPLL